MERKRSWPTEAHSETEIVFNKNLSRDPSFGLENAFIYAIWKVREI